MSANTEVPDSGLALTSSLNQELGANKAVDRPDVMRKEFIPPSVKRFTWEVEGGAPPSMSESQNFTSGLWES